MISKGENIMATTKPSTVYAELLSNLAVDDRHDVVDYVDECWSELGDEYLETVELDTWWHVVQALIEYTYNDVQSEVSDDFGRWLTGEK